MKEAERSYWKVHRDDIKDIKNITDSRIEVFNKVCDGKLYEYKKNDYIYIVIDNDGYVRSFMPYDNDSVEYFKHSGIEYLGHFNLNRNRLKKIKKLNEINLHRIIDN